MSKLKDEINQEIDALKKDLLDLSAITRGQGLKFDILELLIIKIYLLLEMIIFKYSNHLFLKLSSEEQIELIETLIFGKNKNKKKELNNNNAYKERKKTWETANKEIFSDLIFKLDRNPVETLKELLPPDMRDGLDVPSLKTIKETRDTVAHDPYRRSDQRRGETDLLSDLDVLEKLNINLSEFLGND